MHHPELVKKLVTSGANIDPGSSDPEGAAWIRKVKAECGPGDKSGVDCWPKFIHDHYVATAPDPKHWPAFIDRLKVMWLAQPNMTKDQLGTIKTPTLIVAGDHDAVSISETIEMFQFIPGAALRVVPESSHFVPKERAKLFNETVDAFLKETAAPKP